MGIIYGLMRISPKNYSMPNSQEVIGKINFAVVGMLAILQIGMILSSFDHQKYIIEGFLSGSFAFFLIVAGNFMSKVEQNFFIGVRLPWTLASEKNWLATHRFAARLMIIGGTVLLISLFFIQSVIIAISILLISVLLPAVYSYRYFMEYEQ